MTRYLYLGPTQLMDFATGQTAQDEPSGQDEPGTAERVEIHLIQGQPVDVPETDPIVAGWLDRGILAPIEEAVPGAVNGPGVPLNVEDPPPAGDPPPPPPPPLTGVAIPNKDAGRVRRPKPKE